ncbi:Ctr copper transporter family-domain-containing protein [Gymnopilus junonius]|uniref:Copper transport protein n=1 Tax=Gymnopilus junonius TaxID=109634 RepID=A0A9P5TM62_GYMJU|nr:Ctr copper transporter family-domain-containing protein [Gymnopilus junonius]
MDSASYPLRRYSMDSMASPSSSPSNSTIIMMMVPYLHFTGGDALYFKQWQPSSAGAIGGACIGLVFLSIFERWLVTLRRMFDSHWRRRAFTLTAARDYAVVTRAVAPLLSRGSDDKAELVQNEVEEVPLSRPPSGNATQQTHVTMKSRLRTVTPFILAHDLPRGILYTLQMLVAYLLMLAVMTFQAAFLISIVLGLGIGEIFFGRVLDTD